MPFDPWLCPAGAAQASPGCNRRQSQVRVDAAAAPRRAARRRKQRRYAGASDAARLAPGLTVPLRVTARAVRPG